jgi:hypothetical protein
LVPARLLPSSATVKVFPELGHQNGAEYPALCDETLWRLEKP